MPVGASWLHCQRGPCPTPQAKKPGSDQPERVDVLCGSHAALAARRSSRKRIVRAVRNAGDPAGCSAWLVIDLDPLIAGVIENAAKRKV